MSAPFVIGDVVAFTGRPEILGDVMGTEKKGGMTLVTVVWRLTRSLEAASSLEHVKETE